MKTKLLFIQDKFIYSSVARLAEKKITVKILKYYIKYNLMRIALGNIEKFY